MVVPVAPRVQCRCSAAPVQAVPAARVSVAVMAAVVVAAGYCSAMVAWVASVARPQQDSAALVVTAVMWAGCRCWVPAVPGARVARALTGSMVSTDLSRALTEPVVPMAAMAVKAVTVVRAAWCSAVAVPGA